MIRVAAGEKLSITQADVKLAGWAVESRVYAEDPTRGFLPSTGRLTRYRPPEEGKHGHATVRCDAGVEEGGEISIYYDPMIAKLVTHAPTRAEAIEAQSQALDAFVIEGIRHNIPFLATLMGQERWRSGKLSTGYIADAFPNGFSVPEPAGEAALQFAAVALSIDHLLNLRKRQISSQMETLIPVRFSAKRSVRLGARFIDAEILEGEEGLVIGLDDHEGAPRRMVIESAWRPGQPVWQGRIDETDVVFQVKPILNGFHLLHGGAAADAHVYTRREAELARLMPEKKQAATRKALLCPMPGLVKSIAVEAGAEVKAGEVLAVVEAMKMENVLRAERDVTIKAVKAKPGETLAFDAVIMEFA